MSDINRVFKIAECAVPLAAAAATVRDLSQVLFDCILEYQ